MATYLAAVARLLHPTVARPAVGPREPPSPPQSGNRTTYNRYSIASVV
jgi:hypothetical protein